MAIGKNNSYIPKNGRIDRSAIFREIYIGQQNILYEFGLLVLTLRPLEEMALKMILNPFFFFF